MEEEKPEMKRKRPTLNDPDELKLIQDIYMDPEHPLLGEEGQELLQRKRIRERHQKNSPR